MPLTSLNLSDGTPSAVGRPAKPRRSTDCPRCGAKKDKRETAGGFGPGSADKTYCGNCAYEFQEHEL